MKKRLITTLSILAIGISLILYITNEDFRDRIGTIKTDFSRKVLKNQKDESAKWLSTRKHNEIKGSAKKRIKDKIPFDSTDDEDSDIDEVHKLLDKQTHPDKSNNIHTTQALKNVYSEDTDITSAEIDQFHDKNNEEYDNKEVGEEDMTSESPSPVTSSIDKIEHTGELKKRFPQAIIAGVKKCGTRALLSFLSSHPLVKSAGREMHFFDKNDTYSEGLDWYLDQMPESYENELTMEKTPAYFVINHVPKRVFEFSKSVKLIFIFKDPVQRVISDYAQAIANGKSEVHLEKLIFTKSKKRPKVVNAKSSKISIGLYAKHLLKWFQYFPKIQMHFVNGDEFIRNPVPAIINVQKFLGLPVMLNEKNFMFNKTKGFYCLKDFSKGKAPTKCLGESKGRKHPDVKESTLKKLTKFYKPHNERFFELIGQDFGWQMTQVTNSKPTEIPDDN